MSAPFVTQLRAARQPIKLAEPGPGTITLRVEASDIWDTVRVIARPDTPVAELKKRVVAQLFPNDQYADEFVLKLHGWEVLDERASLAESGLVDGSILLLAYRRRRAVR
jgi:hypothetical protein